MERDILTATKTPWLVRLLYAFQDREHVYLAMVSTAMTTKQSCKIVEPSVQEYVPGGDFRTLLNNSGVLKEEHARFYSAEMFMGVNELHKLGYIHRDLKPEVISKNLDFGSAALIPLRPSTELLGRRFRSRQAYGLRIGYWCFKSSKD